MRPVALRYLPAQNFTHHQLQDGRSNNSVQRTNPHSCGQVSHVARHARRNLIRDAQGHVCFVANIEEYGGTLLPILFATDKVPLPAVEGPGIIPHPCTPLLHEPWTLIVHKLMG